MRNNYRRTMTACLTGYVVQAVINNLAPLLFLTFQSTYNIPLSQITVLITVNFGVQLSVDLLSVFFVDRIGYRASMLTAHACAALGLIFMSFLPDTLGSPFAGLMVSVVLYALGGGLLEVLASPIVEACPTDNKEKAMSMLHSFYCWGQVAVILLSTMFFRIFGISCWRILALIWAALPVVNGLVFTRVPINTLIADGEKGMGMKKLFKSAPFWLFMLMMMCAGASELTVSQWASTLAEKGLGVSKAVCDLAGPMLFAALMGFSRAFYGKFRRPHKSEPLYADFLRALRVFISAYFFRATSRVRAFGLRTDRTFSRNNVARNLQQSRLLTETGRNGDVRALSSRGRRRLYERSHSCGLCFRTLRRQSSNRSACRNRISSYNAACDMPAPKTGAGQIRTEKIFSFLYPFSLLFCLNKRESKSNQSGGTQ